MKARYTMLAGYNAWANRRLYDACAKLSEAEFHADRGAFFKSLSGTLNHILVTDRIWMKRFTGTGDAPDRLDAILHEDLPSLRQAREAEDARIAGWIERLSEADLSGTFRYRRASSPEEFEQELAPALDHLFNHETHHRGQAHCLLTLIAGAAPELDLIFYQREAGLGGMRRLG